ncbi:photosynthetic reaction center subunit M, partial [Planktomarina temperata]|nr:photosynthetic reaction center subunit M [Planktomarina temperata]
MEYQNIFTQVQVQGPPEMGMDPTGDIARERTSKAGFSKLAGILGNAQLGPLHLG